MIIIVLAALIGAIYVAEETPKPVKITTKEIVEHERKIRREVR